MTRRRALRLFGAVNAVGLGSLTSSLGATPVHGGHVEDVNGDGSDDLVLHFPSDETGLGEGDAAGKLVGETHDGAAVFGTDAVRVAGGHEAGSDGSRDRPG